MYNNIKVWDFIDRWIQIRVLWYQIMTGLLSELYQNESLFLDESL